VIVYNREKTGLIAGNLALESCRRTCQAASVATFTNVSTYCFAELDGLAELRAELLQKCRQWNLKGTILLSREGINLFVAGEQGSIEALMDRLRQIPGLEGLTPKLSYSDHQPFNRMLVRLKKEIISFGIEGVNPARYTSAKLPPRQLKQWLDEGRPVTLLDTRNDYEVKLGTFRGAIDPDIKTFRGFPEAVRELPEELKQRPVVMFCTGGIRCEKAGPFMEMEGFKEIYQLEGGILKYFEECGGDHYDGDCFVFDQRVGVDPALSETPHAVCFHCQAPLDVEDQADPRYVAGVSCPHCHVSEPELIQQRVAERQAMLDAVCDPLPGSEARENRRPFSIKQRHDRWRLIDVLADLFPHIEAAQWQTRCDEGRFVSYRGEVRGAEHVVRAGERVLQIFPPEVEPEVSADIRILHEDEAIVVLHKPAPLPMHPSGRFHRNTLQFLVNQCYTPPQVVRIVHRLDANTSGLVVLARTRHFAKLLQRQFIEGRVEKRYLVRVQGQPRQDSFICEAPITDEAGAAGSRTIDEANGLPSRTEFTVLQRLEDGTSLLEAIPVTGRTNQIRIHLWHLGMPVVGDPTYLPGGEVADTQTLGVEDEPMQLMAWKLAFEHPLKHQRVEFEDERPTWA